MPTKSIDRQVRDAQVNAEKANAKLKELKQKQAEMERERKGRTSRLCSIGGSVEKAMGYTFLESSDRKIFYDVLMSPINSEGKTLGDYMRIYFDKAKARQAISQDGGSDQTDSDSSA